MNANKLNPIPSEGINILVFDEAEAEVEILDKATLETVMRCFPSPDVLVENEELYQMRLARLRVRIPFLLFAS